MKYLLKFIFCFMLTLNAHAQLYINGGGVADIDGNEYSTILINGQEWMSENLRVSKYSNEDPIANLGGYISIWSNATSGAYCWYNNDVEFDSEFGKIYNGYAIVDPRNVCPTGWHVPTPAEWTSLIDFLGGETIAGGKLKSTTYWSNPNVGATNESGFSAKPGGMATLGGGSSGLFSGLYSRAFFWGLPGSISLYQETAVLGVGSGTLMGNGLSVRCINDELVSYNSIISGKVYEDYNLNNILDNGEPSIAGEIVSLTYQGGNVEFQTTTENGGFLIMVPNSGVYTLSYKPRQNWIETGGVEEYVLNVDNDVLTDVHFGIGYTDTIIDLETDLTLLSETQFGPSFQGWVSTSNSGNITTGLGTLVSGSGTTTVNVFVQSDSTVQPGQITSDIVNWNQTAEVTTTVSVHVNAISSLGTDVNLNNNSDSKVVDIVIPPSPPSPPCCPYDPNDKTVFGATCEANYVVIGDTLEYMVRFMNTGTAPANTVILKDTLDLDYLDLLTFRPIGYSHDMNWDISGPGILTVTYPDIQLPDSSVSFLESQGFFKYRIVMHDTVSNLTEIGSATYIYFDNEAPIQTNTPSIIAVDSIPVLSLLASSAICDGSLGYITGSVSFDIGIVEADWTNGSTDYPLGYNTEDMFSGFLTDAYGCVYEDSIQTVCDLVSSLSDGEANQLSIYPNPTSGFFEITGTGELSIHNALGELVLTENISGNATIDLSTQVRGIYTFQLQTKKETFTRKVIKE